MASAWLIKRFIDPKAAFVFVPAGAKVLPKNAEPFDIPGARLSHRRGHATFHTLLREYDLKDPILQRMARIVDEADVVQEVTVEPIAPGLDMICRGLRASAPDDRTAFERGALIYEALYTQLGLEARSEGR